MSLDRWGRQRCPRGHVAGPQCPDGCKRTKTLATTREQRFWAKVDMSGGENACWIWQASRCGPQPQYGSFGSKRAHIVAWQITYGEYPQLDVLHTCDNRLCCNPGHLFLGTHSDNMADMVAKGRQQHGVRHWNARLTATQVSEIRADPRASNDIAPAYGVSARTIRKIRQGLIWRAAS